ncbi:MAG: hypothetical protein D6803_07500, partial [Anaerolineae bacterium]
MTVLVCSSCRAPYPEDATPYRCEQC